MKFIDLENNESILTDPRHIKFDYIKILKNNKVLINVF